MNVELGAPTWLRATGAGALWLAGFTGALAAAAWLGSGFTVTGFHVAVIATAVGLLAVGLACSAAVFAADWRRDAHADADAATVAPGGDGVDADTVRVPAAA